MDNKKMDFTRYEKISDKVLDLSYSTKLKMNVVLGRKSKDRRLSFYSECKYNVGNKYINVNSLYSIQRNFDYFLTIEKGDERIMPFIIRDEDIIPLRAAMNQVYKDWLFFGFDNKVFNYIKGHNLVIARDKWNTISVNLSNDRVIGFEPAIATNYNRERLKGIRILLNSNNIYFVITEDKFTAFLYHINNINLFQSAQIMINSLQPQFLGTNQFKYGSVEVEDNKPQVKDYSPSGNVDRLLGKNINSIDSLE